jgi:hypothetical protein
LESYWTSKNFDSLLARSLGWGSFLARFAKGPGAILRGKKTWKNGFDRWGEVNMFSALDWGEEKVKGGRGKGWQSEEKKMKKSLA